MSKAAAAAAAAGPPVGGEVLKTGREVDNIIQSLMRHAADADEGVRAQLAFAVHALGVEQPLLVISALCVFLARNGKLEQQHRVVLLRMLAQLLETQTARAAVEEAEKSDVPAQQQLVTNLVKYLAKEMTSSQEAVADISVPCSTCLALLANVNCSVVVEECLSLFPAGQLPHYYLVKTLADVAAAEPVAFVQKLKEVMARMTPVIGGIKKSPMKWSQRTGTTHIEGGQQGGMDTRALALTTYGRFSESMGHYQAHALESGTEATITSASFEIHMASAFDVMFNSWLPEEKEAKVRFACLESLGHMCLLLDRPALEMRLPKLVPAYLMKYKSEKPQDHLAISHGLCSTLKEAVKTPALAPLLPTILMAIHPMVSRPVDFAFPSLAKNHNELLRCFEILARYDLESVLQFVIGRFQLKERESRMASLLILRHFVNSLDELLTEQDRKPSIMASLLTMVGEQDLSLRKTILQLIVSMANHNYMQLEGGQNLIKFCLQQCSIQVEGEDRDGKITLPAGKDGAAAASSQQNAASPLQIRNAANHILGVMATKVPSTHKVLWPYLLELVIEPEFSRSACIMFKVLDHVGGVKRTEGHPDYIINWEAQVNMPPPQAVLCRMMILASEPFRRGEAGLTMCRAMATLGGIIHPAIGKYFDESAPSLVAHLESHSQSTLNVSKWQDTLLKLWKETLTLVEGNSKWMQDLATVLGEQFKLYKGDEKLQRCVHRYLGCVLARVESRATLQAGIDLMLNTVNHASDVERQGCAQGLGLCASVHLDVVLPKLTEKLTPKVVEKKSTGFFGFGGGDNKPQGPDDKLASTIVLCYGYVAAYANPELIVSRLDVHILHNIIPLLAKARSTLLKIHLIKSIDLIGKAIHSSRLPEAKRNWKLAQRDELMTGLCGFLDDKVQKAQQAKPSLEVKLLGVNAAATLANLEPPIPSDLRRKLTEAVFPYYGLNPNGDIGPAPAEGRSPPAASPKDSPKDAKQSTYVDADGASESGESMMELIITNLHTLLATLVNMEPTVPSLVELLKLLEPWAASARTVERERASASYLVVLKKFVSKCVHEKVPMAQTAVPELGHFLAGILVRCNDSSLLVRQTATENVQALLYINQVLKNPDNPKPVQEIKLLTDIRNRLDEASSDDRMVILRDLCSLLTAVVGVNDLMVLQEGLLSRGLLDKDQSAAQGAALIFKTFLFAKASEMTLSVRPFVTGMLAGLKALRVGEVCDITLAALRILTRCHFNDVVGQLLEAPVPLPREVIDAVTALVETGPSDPTQVPTFAPGLEPGWDLALADKTLLHFLQVLNETPLEKDKPTPVLSCATACMAHMMRVDSIRTLIDTHYAPILCTLLMRIGTACVDGSKANASSIDATGAVRAFLESADEDVLLKRLDSASVWPVLESDKYDDGMTTVTRALSEVHPERKRSLLAYLSRFFSQQSYTGQRIVATAMLAEFVNHSSDDVTFLREVIRFLLPRVADKVNKVRKQALRGLGHLVTVWNAETAAMATSVLASLTAAAEDADADVAAEAVLSLTRIVGVVSESLIGPMLISICFRLRPAFDRKEELVRARAFTLFGALARFGAPDNDMDEGVRGNFLDQLHASVPIFIVHANDAAESVRTATVEAFRCLASLLGGDFVPVLEEATGEPHNYDELVQRMCPLLNAQHADRLRGYLDNTTQYFSAVSTSIRGNAAYLAGVLISTASPEQRRTTSIPALTSELLRLLDDPQAAVRSRSAKALSLCHHI